MNPYEQRFADVVGAKHAVAFAYARHGLIAILKAAGLRNGDEVVVPALTCKVVPLALLAAGFRPIYADICEDTLNLDAKSVQAAVTPRTRAVLFQHTYGSSLGIEAVAEVAARHGFLLVEDCAQCTPRPEFPLHGKAAFFSNNLRKPLPAGSGGVVVTNDAPLAGKLLEQREHLLRLGAFSELLLALETWVHRWVLRPSLYWPLYGLARRFSSVYRSRTVEQEIAAEVTDVSFRPSPRQLRLGSRWLRTIPDLVNHRRLCRDDYTAALGNIRGIRVPRIRDGEPLYYYPLLMENKRALLDAARRNRLELVAWPLWTPIYPVEKDDELLQYGYERGSCPVAEAVSQQLVGLPTDLSATAGFRAGLIQLVRQHANGA